MIRFNFNLSKAEFKQLKIRISYIFTAIPLGLILVQLGCGIKASPIEKKVIVIGFDGMDYQLTKEMMDNGRLPNFKRLQAQGSFLPLGTSIPPQSPVAWSNFITGMNPGGHGIFDFIHRDPKTMLPLSSTSKTEDAENTITLGDWVVPLSSGKVELLRKGVAFWEILEDSGVPTTVFRVPANFPPVESKGKSLSGMGTPDLSGTFGTFSYYTTNPPANRDDISGGVIYPVKMSNFEINADLVGPRNTFRKQAPEAKIPFKVWCDPEQPTAKIVVQDKEILLKEKEWSEWIQLEFELIPGLQSVTGICRFYLKKVGPDFGLYVTPINIDPSNPALPISTPESYAKELQRSCGFFYTQGMPEDTKALSWGVFDHDDFRSQSGNVLEERLRLFEHILKNYENGLLFFYFSSTDLNAHMFWNMIDTEHPGYDAKKAVEFADVITAVYEAADNAIGKVLARVDLNTTLLVISDHGFAPFRRAVHLNTWLKDEGYLTLLQESKQAEIGFFQNVDWRKTRAYGVGFNGLYINQRGREKDGQVATSQKDALLEEISQKLLELRDPVNGEKVVACVYLAKEIYSTENLENAPDLIVGYNRGYRASWETVIGGFPLEWISDNMDPWSGDHCMAAELVPGIILSNKAIKAEAPKLYDLAPTILAEFGAAKKDAMVGNSIF